MQYNQRRLALLLTQKLRYTPRDERVADSMEAILPQSILLCNLLIYRIRRDVFGEGLVELAIEDSNVPRPG